MTPERRRQLLAASRLGRAVAGFAGPAGEKGDLDPDGHWRTVSGNNIHIDSNGEIDAGGPPVLRQILAEKAGLHPKGTKAAAEGGGAAPNAPGEPPAKAKKVRLEASDKSVGDYSTKAVIKDGQFQVALKLGKIATVHSFAVPLAEYPAGSFARDQYLGKLVPDTVGAHAGERQRLIDSVRKAIEKVSQKATAAGVTLPRPKVPGTPPKLAEAVAMIGAALDGTKRLNMADVVKAVPDLHPRAVVAVVNQLYRMGAVKRFPDETFRLGQQPSVLRDLIRTAFRDLGVREQPDPPAAPAPPPAPAATPEQPPAATPAPTPAAPPTPPPAEKPAKKAKAPKGPSHRTEITEGGKVFKTGEPVTFPMMRNLVPAPKAPKDGTDPYHQKVEPAGRYMSHAVGWTPETGSRTPNYAYESVTFKNPLVVPLNTGGPNNRIYDENSWKMNLSREFGGKKGQSLSNAVARAGHDGIVTVDKYGTSEIVDLRHLHPKQGS